MKSLGNIVWFQNIQQHYAEPLNLTATYDPLLYPAYDNYNVIEVGRTKDIPKDYYSIMGVPLSFYTKFNPQQFEIIWTTDRGGDGYLDYLKKEWDRYDAPVINGGKGVYKRIFIRRKQ